MSKPCGHPPTLYDGGCLICLTTERVGSSMVEHLTFNEGDAGSSPARLTTVTVPPLEKASIVARGYNAYDPRHVPSLVVEEPIALRHKQATSARITSEKLRCATCSRRNAIRPDGLCKYCVKGMGARR